jgi:hypothetical protein
VIDEPALTRFNVCHPTPRQGPSGLVGESRTTRLICAGALEKRCQAGLVLDMALLLPASRTLQGMGLLINDPLCGTSVAAHTKTTAPRTALCYHRSMFPFRYLIPSSLRNVPVHFQPPPSLRLAPVDPCLIVCEEMACFGTPTIRLLMRPIVWCSGKTKAALLLVWGGGPGGWRSGGGISLLSSNKSSATGSLFAGTASAISFPAAGVEYSYARETRALTQSSLHLSFNLREN